jgi:8-oxo-dGTP pyrophosphatase MutT (NUDIX family)
VGDYIRAVVIPQAQDIRKLLGGILDPVDADPERAWGYGWEGRGDSRLPGEADTGSGRKVPAGVLVPFIQEGDGALSLLFTLRTMKVKDHKGQVSFPGGVFEDGDGSLLHTALRETREEIGLEPDRVEVLGRLRPYDTITGYRIHPFVGVLDGRPEVTPSDVEIEEVFFVGLETLMDRSTFQESSVQWEGRVYEVRAYEWGGPVIWGATANILSELIERLRT